MRAYALLQMRKALIIIQDLVTATVGRGIPACCRRLVAVVAVLCLHAAYAPAQPGGRTLTGTVTDAKTGAAVGYVTCKALNAADSLLAYAITTVSGAFTLALPEGTSAVEFTLIGYEKKRVKASAARQGMAVSLVPSGVMLKELTVKARPVDVRKDTVNYNVAAFQGKEDRYIEDVLRKLPGIEVSADGAISYKGEPVNKVNIEGQDLLGNQYNQATRNMPAEAVATVQVMEDDQPIRALKDRVPSNRATLNLKLKQGYRLRPFGEVKGGIGGGDGTIWNNALTLINIGKKNQMLFTGKMNNSGENLSANTAEHIDVTDIDGYEPLPAAMIAAATPSRPPVSEKRYLRNKSYSAGLNHLHRIGRYGSLRTNISYYGTSDRSEDSTYNLYGGETTLALAETGRIRRRTHTILPRLRYELNAPSMYLVDELSGSLSFDSGTSAVTTARRYGTQGAQTDGGKSPAETGGEASALTESTAGHPGYVQNKLQMTLSSGPRSYSVSSLLRYFRRSETLAVAAGGDPYAVAEALSQRIELQRIMTRNSVSTSFWMWGNNLELKYTFELRSDNVAADASPHGRTTYMEHTLTPGYTVRYARGFVGIDVPVSVFTSDVPWSSAGDGTEVYLSPTLRWRHEFSPFWRMNVMGFMRRSASTDVMMPEEYASDYRTRLLTADRIGWTRSSGASFSLNYSNMISLFVWNFMASASWSRADHSTEYTYGDRLTTARPVWRDTDTRMLFVMTSVDKTFAGTGGAVKASLHYNRTELPVAQNGVDATITANTLTAAMTLRWNKWKWLSLTDSPTFNLTWQDPYALNAGHNTLKSFYNEADVHLFLLAGLDVSLSWEYNLLEVERGRYRHNSFVDVAVRYSLTKRTDLRLALSNLLNRRVYEEASFTGINYGYFSLPLRGREVMLSVAVSF